MRFNMPVNGSYAGIWWEKGVLLTQKGYLGPSSPISHVAQLRGGTIQPDLDIIAKDFFDEVSSLCDQLKSVLAMPTTIHPLCRPDLYADVGRLDVHLVTTRDSYRMGMKTYGQFQAMRLSGSIIEKSDDDVVSKLGKVQSNVNALLEFVEVHTGIAMILGATAAFGNDKHFLTLLDTAYGR